MRIISMFLITCLLLPVVPFSAFAQSDNTSDYNFVGDAIIESEYKLGPGDQVAANLIVAGNELALDYSFSVGPDGKIYFPNIGELDLLGMTIPEAKKVVDERIKAVYKKKYDLSFRLIAPRRMRIYVTGSEEKPLYLEEQKYVHVYGEVSKRGRFIYLPNKKYSDYISYAGGPTAMANLALSTITRKNDKIGINGSDVIFNGDVSKDMTILSGDVINIPCNFFYFTDFASFANTVLLALTLYTTVVRR